MADQDDLGARLSRLRQETAGGPPRRTSNPFFGVGPITDAAVDEVDSRLLRYEFEAWLETTYRKLDDRGRDVGPFTAGEIARSMHRGYPADQILLDMMRSIHRYFEFPELNRMAVGLGGGHSGFTVCLMHLVNPSDPTQHVFIDTPRPESEASGRSGFFRQSWGIQLLELHRLAPGGDPARVHFAEHEGAIPSVAALEAMGVKLFIGVGHETTGATTYTQRDMDNLFAWLAGDPVNRHAVLDVTSLLGAMPWDDITVRKAMAKICMFTPFQKAIGGISGYFVASFTPQALALIEHNQKDPRFAVPRQLKLAVPVDPKHPLTGRRTVELGPFYDARQDKMLGGVINTYSALAFAETTFGLLRSARRIGPVSELNRRSLANLATVTDWIGRQDLLALGVTDPESRGTAVTLLKVVDPEMPDRDLLARIVGRSKQLLGYEGITHPDGHHEPGLDVARYLNVFPGTPGDYRAWVGGIRAPEDVTALLDNIAYAYRRAKIVVLDEELAARGHPASAAAEPAPAADRPTRTATVLIADLVGLKPAGPGGRPDHSEVRRHIEQRGAVFHDGPLLDRNALERGRIHFFFQPDLSTEEELLAATEDGRYDAIIAAATFIPAGSTFREGGVRIGAGTGNMGSRSWGGGDGGGTAPLMNTPSFNSRATAQMVLKAMLKVLPDLDLEALHARVISNDFDTGKNLKEFATEKAEGKRIAVLGYGNIGRQVARLARALGMTVVIYSRERDRSWIESEGFAYAGSPTEAAQGAHVLSPHLGLGRWDEATKRHANAGIIGADVLSALADGAVLIDHDRAELIDIPALDAALAAGKLRHVSIDADLFRDAQGHPVGPLAPFLEVERRHRGKVELLPHVAADTDHRSRVEGAKQAVDQIIEAIFERRVVNLKGKLPLGYTDAGGKTVPGVGAVSRRSLAQAAASETLHSARRTAEKLAAIWGALDAATDPARREQLVARYGADLVKASNVYRTLMEQTGIEGRFA